MEVSAAEITLRVGPHWLRFTPEGVERDNAATQPFRLNEDGTVSLADNPTEEMDIAAERFAREILTGSA